MNRIIVALLAASLASCATTTPTAKSRAAALPVASDPSDRCVHGVAGETCVKCHPELAARFEAAGDWCPEHGVPESQCAVCHPEVAVPPPRPPAGADFQRLVESGQDLPSLDPHVVRGKVTIFDFYADWCGPCRKVDAHVFELLESRSDVAYRKLDIVSWESPLAKHYLADAPSLPYVIVYGKDGKPAGKMSGLALHDLDRAIAVGSSR
ncbi:MAG: thioredoxin family protein [Myxococcales bacterium]|nr:thioredoxin family protein [Myxococcales bacterium]